MPWLACLMHAGRAAGTCALHAGRAAGASALHVPFARFAFDLCASSASASCMLGRCLLPGAVAAHALNSMRPSACSMPYCLPLAVPQPPTSPLLSLASWPWQPSTPSSRKPRWAPRFMAMRASLDGNAGSWPRRVCGFAARQGHYLLHPIFYPLHTAVLGFSCVLKSQLFFFAFTRLAGQDFGGNRGAVGAR